MTYSRISPNRTSPRNHKIDTITIHCIVGQWTAKQGCDYFATTGRECSANYVVGKDGSIGLSVEEQDRSWCSSSRSNDHRAITIEVASDTKHPYKVTDQALAALIDLLVDICRRNGIKALLWKGDKSLIGQVDKQNMTVHRWFANKSCPGNWLYEHHGQIAKEVNERLEEENMVRYERLRDIKNKEFHDIVEKLMDANILGGDGSDPTGNEDIIDLSHDMVRTLVLEYRGGAFDRKLKAVGMEPAVKD